ncbi:hypothetical protein QVD17_36378 [Tagetes erecta]|uniref:Uncharacterized protein n=1 Tax=Tagetes erecta TaxID=13708 RepID=A0AAD8NHC6_TARER|nr:hypothetical protein QVD17_36378 [Tagetes erecta]
MHLLFSNLVLSSMYRTFIFGLERQILNSHRCVFRQIYRVKLHNHPSLFLCAFGDILPSDPISSISAIF